MKRREDKRASTSSEMTCSKHTPIVILGKWLLPSLEAYVAISEALITKHLKRDLAVCTKKRGAGRGGGGDGQKKWPK